MGSLKSFISSTKLWLYPKPEALESSILSKLPPELIIYIARFLPAASAASFTLTCKPLYSLLAIPYLKCKRGHHPFNTTEFLSLLQRDIRDCIACYHCEKLHAIKPEKRFTRDTSRCDARACSLMKQYIGRRFSFVVFQMAMKRHRQGADTSRFLKLLHRKSASSDRDMRAALWARIVDGALVIRKRWIFIAHPSSQWFVNQWGADICPHLGRLAGRMIHQSDGKIEYDMFLNVRGKEDKISPGVQQCDCCAHGVKSDVGTTWSQLMQCVLCSTEFRVDSMPVGKNKQCRAFVVTWWKNLGEGRSAEDFTWQAHVTNWADMEAVLPASLINAALVGKKLFPAGSICAAFEGKGEVELESLLTQKEKKRLAKLQC